jgi:hypothetical protein
MNELLLAIFKDIDTHINAIVDKRVAEIMGNHETVATINEDFEDQIRSVCKAMLYSHMNDESHYDRSDIEEITYDAIGNYEFSDILNEHDFSDTITDSVHSELDNVLPSAIAEKLNDTKFVITGGTITTEV